MKINLASIKDTEFVGWKTEEVSSLLRTSTTMSEEILDIVKKKITV